MKRVVQFIKRHRVEVIFFTFLQTLTYYKTSIKKEGVYYG